MHPDMVRSNISPLEDLYICSWCQVRVRFRMKTLKIDKDQLKYHIISDLLRIGKSRNQWKRFRKKAYVRSIDLDVPNTSQNMMRILMGMMG